MQRTRSLSVFGFNESDKDLIIIWVAVRLRITDRRGRWWGWDTGHTWILWVGMDEHVSTSSEVATSLTILAYFSVGAGSVLRGRCCMTGDTGLLFQVPEDSNQVSSTGV